MAGAEALWNLTVFIGTTEVMPCYKTFLADYVTKWRFGVIRGVLISAFLNYLSFGSGTMTAFGSTLGMPK